MAGVSAATVSRALRGVPGVSAATRAAVEQAAEQLGYVPSRSATSLSTGRTGAIGIIAPWLSRWFFAAAIEGVQEVLRSHGYDALLYPAGTGMLESINRMDVQTLHKRVDGVLALNMPVGLDMLQQFQIPLVSIGGSYVGRGAVAIDDVLVGRLATQHLIELAHRDIAFLGRDPDAVYGFTAAADRLLGYREAHAQAGLPVDERLIITSGFELRRNEEAFSELWQRGAAGDGPHPTAVFAVSDEAAMSILHAAKALGVSVPDELSVIGVDNHDLSYLVDLTTVAQPVRAQGRAAAAMLIEQIETGEIGPKRLLEPSLITRGTTAAPASR